MKTAAKFCMTALAAVLGAGLASAAYAQDAIAINDSPITTTVPGPSSAPQVTTPDAPKVAAPISPSAPVVNPADSADKKPAVKAKKKAARSSSGVPDSVQDIVGRLDTDTKDVTLEDLNAAREAVVKLDVLIDIQKRMNDLAKLRGETSSRMVAPIAAALPQTALDAIPVPTPTPTASETAGSVPSIAIPSEMLPGASFTNVDLMAAARPPQDSGESHKMGALDVARISGTSGDYIAVIKDSMGKAKTVHKGDTLSDGTRIVSISREGVTVQKGEETKTIQVKDVSRVFGRR